MELKDVRTGMFLSWNESGKTVTALVSNVFFGKTNFEFAVAAYIVPQQDAGGVTKTTEDVEVENGFKVKTEVLTVNTGLKAFPLERYPHPMRTQYPVNERTFICTDEMFESAADKIDTLRYATFAEVNALVSGLGFGGMSYKPFVFRYGKKTEYVYNDGVNVKVDRYLNLIDNTDILDKTADGVANIDGVFYAVNVDSYLKNGVVGY